MTREQFETGIKRAYIVVWAIMGTLFMFAAFAEEINASNTTRQNLVTFLLYFLTATVPFYLLQLVVKYIYFGFYPKNQG